MAKNLYTGKIINYLKENKSDTIVSYDISDLSLLKKTLKDCALVELDITNDIWNSNSEHISSYIRALLTIKYLKAEKKDIYKSLLECKKKDDIMKTIDGKLPKGYSSSHNVCKHIIREIKSLKKIGKVPTEEVVEAETIENDVSENNVVIDNNEIQKEVVEIRTNSTKNKSKKEISTAKDLNSIIESDNELLNKLLNITDDKIKKSILEKFEDTYNISLNIIEEWINTYKNQRPIIIEENKPIKKLALLKENPAKEIENLHSKIDELNLEISHLKDENSTLLSELEDTNKQLENYKYKTPNLSSKHIFSVEIKELSRMLNGNSSESNITIKNEILNRISKYIDENSLINISDIIDKNRDLKSEIVQVVLLAFLHEKSIL
ncbi:hypothetical protein [Clostridium tertium]|jgi:hypothetical protein|uniref:hypothetical protein n=1 Tax=Clostridium tertium TaxID=1559 RepID=UPI0011587705|nr:hypothetical protein [Clostridium tertium]